MLWLKLVVKFRLWLDYSSPRNMTELWLTGWVTTRDCCMFKMSMDITCVALIERQTRSFQWLGGEFWLLCPLAVSTGGATTHMDWYRDTANSIYFICINLLSSVMVQIYPVVADIGIQEICNQRMNLQSLTVWNWLCGMLNLMLYLFTATWNVGTWAIWWSFNVPVTENDFILIFWQLANMWKANISWIVQFASEKL